MDKKKGKVGEQSIVVFDGSEGNESFYEYMSLNRRPEDEDLDDDEICEKYEFDDFYAGSIWESADSKLPKDVDVEIDATAVLIAYICRNCDAFQADLSIIFTIDTTP